MNIVIDREKLYDAMLEWKSSVLAMTSAVVEVRVREKEEREKAEIVAKMLRDAEEAQEGGGDHAEA